MKKLFIAVASIALVGCVSTPDDFSVQNKAFIQKDFEGTWTTLMEFFTSSHLQIKTIEKASGLVYAEQVVTSARDIRTDEFMSCGSAFLEVPRSRSIKLNVFVKPNKDTTHVSVNTDLKEMRCVGNTCTAYQCNSTGKIEKQILDYLKLN